MVLRERRLPVVLFIAFAVPTSCAMQQLAVAVPAELIVAEGATDVRSRQRPGGGHELLYRLNQPYPAVSLLATIHAALPSERWQPLADDWLNPGVPSSHEAGWSSFINGMKTPNTIVHRWYAQWKDREGNLVIYGLTYDNAQLPTSSQVPDNSRLEVAAAWLPTSLVKSRQEAVSADPPGQIR